MPLRVSNLRLGIELPESVLPQRVARVLGLPPSEIARWRILRKSLDARDGHPLTFVYSVEVQLAGDERRAADLARRRSRGEVRLDLYEEPPFVLPPAGSQALPERPVVVGSGPGGLVA